MVRVSTLYKLFFLVKTLEKFIPQEQEGHTWPLDPTLDFPKE